MRVYYASTEGFDASRALVQGRSASAGSAAAWSLLLYVLRRDYGLYDPPEPALNSRGKPYFPSLPGISFSLSHTRGCALCAVAGCEVGADVQLISPRDEPFAERLMDESERASFTLHELWCLREAVYKLTGEGSLRDMRFRREGREIIAPVPGVVCRLYGGIPGCEAAAAVYEGAVLSKRVERVPTKALQKSVVMRPGN